MKKIIIEIHDENDPKPLNGLIDINSDDNHLCISYSDDGYCNGLQCRYEGDTDEFKTINGKLIQIADLVRELVKVGK